MDEWNTVKRGVYLQGSAKTIGTSISLLMPPHPAAHVKARHTYMQRCSGTLHILQRQQIKAIDRMDGYMNTVGLGLPNARLVTYMREDVR